MNQSIDFLKAIPQIPRYLPAIWIAWIVTTKIVLCLGISVALGIAQHLQNQTLKTVRSQRIEAQKTFQQVAQAYPLLAVDKPLVEQVSEYENTLQEKQKRFVKLTHATLRHPFSQYMQALSTDTPEGLWLTTINIDQDIKNVSLIGYSLQPASVSLLLQALQKSVIFKEIVFDWFHVKKVSDKDYIQFEIASKRLIGPEKGESQ